MKQKFLNYKNSVQKELGITKKEVNKFFLEMFLGTTALLLWLAFIAYQIAQLPL